MSSRTRRGNPKETESTGEMVTYDDIMGLGAESAPNSAGAAKALSTRLQGFRKWLTDEAKATVHSAICIVNGEATDGTRNAPVLIFEPPPQSAPTKITATGRLGAIDGESHLALYDRTMGCQIRAVREIKKDETIMTIPRGAMITPDLVAASDAGKAVLACCKATEGKTGFWDAFENTTICENKNSHKSPRSNGPQMLVKILQERKKAETVFQKHMEESNDGDDYTLIDQGIISTRAPLLAFLIHQRFADSDRPLVSSSEFSNVMAAEDENALKSATLANLPPGCPETFAPYARTLPSSISIPLCWKRNELALLTGCLPGLALLHDVATRTLLLASEFNALLNAGLHKRFPDVFPKGLFTWERWIWAAAIASSRTLPASCYLDADVEDIHSFKPIDPLEFQSPADIWKELGVMIPLLDMVNHEIEANQITWQPPTPGKVSMSEGVGDGDDTNDDSSPRPPRAIVHKKIRKGAELFSSYGNLGNHELVSQYGFALMNNSSDEVRLGWGLAEAVGNTGPPHDHKPAFEISNDFVFESNDEKAINAWWTEERLNLLKQEALTAVDDASIIKHLVSGKKLTTAAYNDGSYHPVLLTVAVVATMPVGALRRNLTLEQGSKVVISPRHQIILLRYLQFSFARKLEKLLQNLDNGLKTHFPGINLWTKSSEGGLEYNADAEVKDGDTNSVKHISWQTFFDSHAYSTAVEVEKHYYSLGADSCVLTLYDGQLRALKTSLDGVAEGGKLSSAILKQLVDLGFEFGEKEEEQEIVAAVVDTAIATKEESSDDVASDTNTKSKESNIESGGNGRDENGSIKSPRGRKRNRKNKSATSSRPPALKLHVGNLSYKTTPSDLYDYFCSLYGKDNVLECHIPTERESGRSRGFGFVAMPEEIAQQVLKSGRKHEVGGRAVKIAKSNSVGASINGRIPEAPPPVPADRCVACGYRPKYCTCAAPNPMGADRGMGPHVQGRDRPPDYGRPPRFDYYGSPPEWYRDDRYRDYHDDVDRYGDYDRDRRYRYGESSSMSYERSDDWRMRRDRDRSRDRSRERSLDSRSGIEYEESRGSRRDRRSEGSWDRERKRSRSRSRSKERSRKKKSKRRARSRSPGSP